MCLYPTRMLNPKYKNYPNAHPANKYVTVKCGVCYECRKARGMEWRQRLEQEVQDPRYKDMRRAFITFTISDEVALKHGVDYNNMTLEERVSRETYGKEDRMVKYLVMRWRKAVDKKGIKQRHFFITEHGEDDTLRIHLHGILMTQDDRIEEAVGCWGGGITDIGSMRDSTIGYLCKYMHKMPRFHKQYRSIVLASPGIGSNFVRKYKESHPNLAQETEIKPVIKTERGFVLSMCDYYKKKIYTEKQLLDHRVKMWKENLRWVRGLEYNLNNPRELRNYYQKLNAEQTAPPLGMRPATEKREVEKSDLEMSNMIDNFVTYQNQYAYEKSNCGGYETKPRSSRNREDQAHPRDMAP